MKNKEDLIESLKETCKNVSNRYKNQQEREDLYQEAFLAGFEAIVEAEMLGEEISTLDLYNIVRRACSDWYNIKLCPVHVQPSGASRKAIVDIKRDNLPENPTGTQRLLYAALMGEKDMVEENTLKGNPEEAYILRNLYQKVLDSILTDDVYTINEAFVLYEVFYKERTYQDIGDDISVSRSYVGELYASGLKKLKEKLL